MIQKTVAVTGANGFIGLHIVKTFLEKNYNVVATVRDATNKAKTSDLLALPNSNNLKIVSAELTDSESFVKAFQGVDAVIHNASPLTPENSQEESSFVKPAVEGVENVFNAALKHANTIRNVIQISSMSAVCGAPGSKPDDHKFSEKDWSDAENQRERKAYYSLSKTLAEQRVLQFEEEFNKNNIKIVTICPTLVVGPILSLTGQSGSTTMIQAYVTGDKQEIPNFSMSLVDVRDVAEMCLQSVVQNASGRYICVEKGYTIEQIVGFIAKYVPKEKSSKIPTKLAEGKTAIPSQFDFTRSRQLLGRDFISGEESIKSTVESWLAHNQI